MWSSMSRPAIFLMKNNDRVLYNSFLPELGFCAIRKPTDQNLNICQNELHKFVSDILVY